MNNIIIQVSYLSDYDRLFVHPKFAHLEVKKSADLNITHHYRVYSNDTHISFSIDKKVVNTWKLSDVHFCIIIDTVNNCIRLHEHFRNLLNKRLTISIFLSLN